ncbi:hypothetical protein [Hoyosella altamirensis]|nr:hypothetical protein [Hoyosella altamirensis]MBB3038944.1 hypothetical protein [Hoyosella altamirensis]
MPRTTSPRMAARGAAAIAVAAMALAGCTDAPSTDTAPPMPTETPAFQLPDASALCTNLEERAQEFRTYTPTIGKVTLNGLVANWATSQGVDLLELARNRDAVDVALENACPEVRASMLSYLDIDSIGSAMISLPG